MTEYGEEEIPRSIDRYQVRSLMGSGAMGQVFRAYDEGLDREVAIKLMNALSCSSPMHVERFLREVRTVGQIRHANVVGILDYGTMEKRPFLVMELLDGQDFHQLLQRDGAQAPADCAHWMVQVCRGLEAAHARGVIHRDIKPQNIFLTRTGVVKLLDFGVARTEESDLTGTGHLVGTVDYIAPERILGKPGDHRSDLFAVGVLLHEMLSGAKPFGGKSVTAILRNIVNTPPADLSPGPPRGLGQVILTALAKEPDQRYQTAGDLARALEPFSEQKK